MKRYGLAGVFIVIAVFVLLCLIRPDERRTVANDIKDLKAAVEKEERERALFFVDEAYADNHGTTYQELVARIDDFYNEADSIKIITSGIKIKIDSSFKDRGSYASCSLGLRVFARYGGERMLFFGGIIKPGPVRACFRKNGEHYRIYSAQY
jgi:hypothetical protein